MDKDDRYTRITLRIPKDLHSKLSDAADETSKSMNAEIIARLEDSVLRDTPVDELVNASKAKELAALARRDLSEAIRKEVILDLRSAISKGMSVCFVGLADYDLEEMGDDEFAEVVSGIEAELIKAGYSIAWDGHDTLTVAFDGHGAGNGWSEGGRQAVGDMFDAAQTKRDRAPRKKTSSAE